MLSWDAYHPRKVVFSPQNDDPPLLCTPISAYFGNFFPPLNWGEDITLQQVMTIFSFGDSITIDPVTLPVSRFSPLAISFSIRLSREISSSLDKSKSFSTSGYPMPCSHFDTACLLTSSNSASFSWEIFFSFLICFRFSAKLISLPPFIDYE